MEKFIIFGLVSIIVLGFWYYNVQTKFLFPNSTKYADCPPIESNWTRMNFGISMMPFISQGNWMKFVPYESGMEIKSGNLIMFKKNNESVTHQVIAVYQDHLTTQGLNNNASDGGIDLNQVTGIITDVRFC